MYYYFVIFKVFFPAFVSFSFEEFMVIGQDRLYKLNGEVGDHVSCLLPLSSRDSIYFLQPLVPNNGVDVVGE
jgi:hypothetical protein